MSVVINTLYSCNNCVFVTVYVCHNSSLYISDKALAFVWHSVLPLASVCVFVCLCACFSCYLHPTSSLPCFLCHSLFLWIDICGKTNQRETSHLSSQINFTPLSASGRIINFTRVLTHPGWVRSSSKVISSVQTTTQSGCIYCMEIQFLNEWRH